MSLTTASAAARSATDPADEAAAAAGEDHFDRLPDSILLVIFNRILDVKALGRCRVVSRRFRSLASQVDDVLVRVDCVISDDPSSPSSSASSSSVKPLEGPTSRVFSNIALLVIRGIVRPLQALGQILRKPADSDCSDPPSSYSSSEVSHHSPTEVLRNFKEIRRLRIELPSGELGVDDGALLKWKAAFGSTLDSCVILGASSVLSSSSSPSSPSSSSRKIDDEATDDGGSCTSDSSGGAEDNGSIPESFYTNGSLKLRVVWTISSLIAASARHYLLQPIIADHRTLESLDLTDADGQGTLSMDREQLQELRVKPVSTSSSSQRTLVPALNMRLWYAAHLDLPGGVVLKGATLVAIQPIDQPRECACADGRWISNAFEEPYGAAARMLLKRRTYCLEMNSF